jgi:Putative beta-barrel porin-2, OmpL-like. bbp2
MLTSLVTSIALTIGQLGFPTPTSEPVPPAPASSSFSSIAQVAAQTGAEAAKQPPEVVPTPSESRPAGPADMKADTKTADAGSEPLGFVRGILNAYKNAFFPPESNGDDQEPKRRAPPEPWKSPPFPGHEYQGYPLIGVPPEPISNPIMMGLYNSIFADAIKDTRIQFYGWATGSGNWGNTHNSNAPAGYWVAPGWQLDQIVFRFERQEDTVQQDHLDWGFRSTLIYGEDYRFTTAGGWFSQQLLGHNLLYGWDPIEQYADLYIPWVAQGLVIRAGRWVACPDIETQLAPDNYMASHSLLFLYDTYTQTGAMATLKVSERVMVQGAIHSGTDMAPWYKGATPTGFLGLRWVSPSNNDAVYTCLNNINAANFRQFDQGGQPAGHDNYNYIVSTWEHRINENMHTKTEGYFMWQHDAMLGGTPSLGPVQPYGSGGGAGPIIPGTSLAYGVLNFTPIAFSKKDYICFRNEFYHDEKGMRTGTANLYTSNTVGWSHTFNSVLQFRPEIGYYRAWDQPAFDNGRLKNMVMVGFDFTFRW